MAEAGSVWVSVIPSLKNFSSKVNNDPEVKKLDVKAKVTPDLTGFRQAVAHAVSGLSISVPVDPDLTGFRNRIATAVSGLAVQVPVTPDLTGFRQRIQTATSGFNSVTINVDADISRALTKILALNNFPITVRVDANITAALLRIQSLGGSTATVNVNLDMGTAWAKLTAFVGWAKTLSIGTLGTAGAIQGVMGLVAALAPAVGILATLPAMAGAGALAVGTLKTAFSGFGDAIGDDPKKAAEALAKMPPAAREAAVAVNGLKPAWKGLQLDVQGRMFDGLATKISGLGNTYIPVLRGAMTGLASDINGSVKDAFDVLSESGNVSGITTGLGFVRQGLASMFASLAPVTQAFTTLFIHGAPYVARFGAWVESGARAFSLFIGNASRAGQITVWIDNAILVFKQLGGIIGNVGSIAGSVFGAMQSSGGGALATLQRLTGELAAGLKTPAGAEMLRSFFTNLKLAVDNAMPGVRLLASSIGLVISTVAPMLPAIGSLFTSVITAMEPWVRILTDLGSVVLPPLLAALRFLAPVLLPLATIIFGLIGAYRAWAIASAVLAAAQLALTAIMALNPFALIALAIAGIVAALVYCYYRFEWFRNLVNAVWQGISTAAMWAWNTILKPTFSAIGTAITAVGQFFVWLWQSVIVPAWNAITTAISWAWSTVIQPVLGFIGTALRVLGTVIGVVLVAPFVIAWNIIKLAIQGAWIVMQAIFYGAIEPALRFLGSAFTWLWQNVVVPVWNGITNAIRVAWGIASAIFNAIVAYVRGAFAAMWNWLWNGVIVPVWNGITNAIRGAWAFISSIFNAAVSYIRSVLGPIFTWLWQNIIQPVWNGITSVIRGAWNVIQGIFDIGKRAVQAVGQAFQSVADWIGRAWATIREAARGPIQFVVDVVYNNGIRPVWNGIAGLFGMPQLNPVRFAEGGVLPGYTPGRDVIPAMLSGGEGILVPEAVRGLGPAFVGWANRHFSGGRSSGGPGTGSRYADGGIASRPRKTQRFAGGGIVDTIGNVLSGAGDFFMSVFTDPGAAVKKLFGGVLGDGARTPGQGGWTDALKRLPGKVVEGVITKVKKWIADMAAMGGGAGGNWGPVASQALAITGQPQSLLWRVLKQIQIESGGNPRAINLWDINAKRGTPSKGLIQTIDPTFRAYRHPGLPNDPYHPLANIVAGIRYAISRYGSIAAIWPKTMGYDSGGVANGKGFMAKQTIRPERVLSPRQTVAFETLVASMSRRSQGIGAGVYDGMSSPGRGGPVIGTYAPQLPEGASVRRFAEEMTHELRRTGMASGVHGR